MTADRQTVVKADDDRAVHIFAAKGQRITDDVARRYGLLEPEKKRVKKAANKMACIPKDKGIEGG